MMIYGPAHGAEYAAFQPITITHTPYNVVCCSYCATPTLTPTLTLVTPLSAEILVHY